jgi:hypothetical protein
MSESANADLVNEYVDTYMEWSSTYGIADGCMEELMAALRVESERATLQQQVRDALTDLARTIETERSLALQQAA